MHDQMIGFLQTALVFLLLTNAISGLVAFYAMKTVTLRAQPSTNAALERKLRNILNRA